MQITKKTKPTDFFDDNALAHQTKEIHQLVAFYSWKLLAHEGYTRDPRPNDYHLFASVMHAHLEQRVSSFEEVKMVDDCFKAKTCFLVWRPQIEAKIGKCIKSDGDYFQK